MMGVDALALLLDSAHDFGPVYPGFTNNPEGAPEIVTDDNLMVFFDDVGGMALDEAMLTGEVLAAVDVHAAARESGDALAEIDAARVLMELIGRLTKPRRAVILQNRDRSTPAMIAQMMQIASGPDYFRVAPTREFASGTPIVFGNDDALPAVIALGRKDKAVAADGRRFAVRYAVVEADALLTSNKADGTAIAEYEAGAPGRLRAIAGNGRLAGIVAAFARGTAGEYVRELAEDDMHGIAPEAIVAFVQPVLVRIMNQEDVTENIGDISNQRGTSDLSPVEQAQNDAKRLDLTSLDIADDGRPTEAAALAFIAAMPESERNNLMDGKNPSQKAYDRLMASVFWKAYGDAELVRLYAQSVDAEIKTILGGMASAAGELAKLDRAGELDIRSVITEAAALAVNAKRQGVKLSLFAQQEDMTLSRETMDVVAMFAEHIRSAKKIGERLRAVARFAHDEFTKEDTDMFGVVEKATRAQVLAQLDAPAEENQVSMFDAIDPLLALELSGKLLEKTTALQTAGEDDPLATVELSGEILDIIRQLNEEDAPGTGPVLQEKFPGYPYADMAAPTVLYRSVSPAELEHILQAGSIKGGSNRFNPWDTRREVFFSDQLNAQTIYQGEEVTRRVENAMQDHPLQKLYTEAVAEVEKLRAQRSAETNAVKQMAITKQVRNAEATADQILKDFRAEMDAAIKQENAANATREYTSAVLETKPITGGRHYSKQFGHSGMGEDSEYGFDPDQVKLSDVAQIHLVKNKQVIKTVTPQELMAGSDAPVADVPQSPAAAPEAAAAPDAPQPDAGQWKTLRSDILSSMGAIAGIDQGTMPGMDRSLFVSSIAGKIRRANDRGDTALAGTALAFVAEAQKQFKKPVFAPANKLWKDVDWQSYAAQFVKAPAADAAPVADVPKNGRKEFVDATTVLKPFLSKSQFQAIKVAAAGEEAQHFYDKMVEMAEVVTTMHKTYQQDGKGMSAIVHLHYFRGGSDWYITEKDREGRGTEQAFGYTILNNDRQNAELGYISIDEIVARGAELDLHWDQQTLAQIKARKSDGDEQEAAPDTNTDTGMAILSDAAGTLGGRLSGFTQSGSNWQYADLTIDGETLRVGVSTGGVVSVNGDPFAPDRKTMNTTLDALLMSIKSRLPEPGASEDESALDAPWEKPTADITAMAQAEFDALVAQLTDHNAHGEVLALRAARTGNGLWHREALTLIAEQDKAGELTPDLKARSEALSAKIMSATSPDAATLPLSPDNLLAAAAELAAAAFAAGMQSAPVLNKDLAALTKNITDTDLRIAAYDAYGKAWHAANAAAPVPGVTGPEETAPVDQPTENAPSMDTLIKIAADSIAQLRRIDVFRVLDAAGDRRESLATYIIEHRPDLQAEVLAVMAEEWPDLGYSAPTAPAVVETVDPRMAVAPQYDENGNLKPLAPEVPPESIPQTVDSGTVAVAPTQNAQRTADLAYFQDVIAEKVDMWDDGLADRLEAMISNYAGDAEMEGKWKEAVTAYTNFMVKAMSQ